MIRRTLSRDLWIYTLLLKEKAEISFEHRATTERHLESHESLRGGEAVAGVVSRCRAVAAREAIGVRVRMYIARLLFASPLLVCPPSLPVILLPPSASCLTVQGAACSLSPSDPPTRRRPAVPLLCRKRTDPPPSSRGPVPRRSTPPRPLPRLYLLFIACATLWNASFRS